MKAAIAEIAIVVGFVLPHLIAILNRQRWRSGTKSVVAFGICLAAAVITVWAKGDLNFKNFIETAGIVWTVAQVSYHGLWKPTGAAPALEASTS